SIEQTAIAEMAENGMGIGNRGQVASAIANGAGIGAGAFGADAERTTNVETGDRAATGSHGVDFEHGYGDRKASNARFGCDSRFAGEQGDIRRSATHVEGKNFLQTSEFSRALGSENAASRPRENGTNWFFRRAYCGNNAAIRLHDAHADRCLCVS